MFITAVAACVTEERSVFYRNIGPRLSNGLRLNLFVSYYALERLHKNHRVQENSVSSDKHWKEFSNSLLSLCKFAYKTTH